MRDTIVHFFKRFWFIVAIDIDSVLIRIDIYQREKKRSHWNTCTLISICVCQLSKRRFAFVCV